MNYYKHIEELARKREHERNRKIDAILYDLRQKEYHRDRNALKPISLIDPNRIEASWIRVEASWIRNKRICKQHVIRPNKFVTLLHKLWRCKACK